MREKKPRKNERKTKLPISANLNIGKGRDVNASSQEGDCGQIQSICPAFRKGKIEFVLSFLRATAGADFVRRFPLRLQHCCRDRRLFLLDIMMICAGVASDKVEKLEERRRRKRY